MILMCFSQIISWWCQCMWIFVTFGNIIMCPLKESAWVNDLHKIHIWNLYHLHEQFSCVLMKRWYCFQNNCYKYHICWDYHFKNYYIWKQNELQGYTGQVSVNKHSNQTIYPESIQFQNFVHSFFQIIFPALEFDSENSS